MEQEFENENQNSAFEREGNDCKYFPMECVYGNVDRTGKFTLYVLNMYATKVKTIEQLKKDNKEAEEVKLALDSSYVFRRVLAIRHKVLEKNHNNYDLADQKSREYLKEYNDFLIKYGMKFDVDGELLCKDRYAKDYYVKYKNLFANLPEVFLTDGKYLQPLSKKLYAFKSIEELEDFEQKCQKKVDEAQNEYGL